MKSRFNVLVDYAKGNLSGSKLMYIEMVLDESEDAQRELKRIEYLLQKKELENHRIELEKALEEIENKQSFLSSISIKTIANYIQNKVDDDEKQEIETFLKQNVFSRETYIDLLLMHKEGQLENYLREQERQKQEFVYQNFISKDNEETTKVETTKTIGLNGKSYFFSIAAAVLFLFVIGIGIREFSTQNKNNRNEISSVSKKIQENRDKIEYSYSIEEGQSIKDTEKPQDTNYKSINSSNYSKKIKRYTDDKQERNNNIALNPTSSTITTLGENKQKTKAENEANNLKIDLETELDLIIYTNKDLSSLRRGYENYITKRKSIAKQLEKTLNKITEDYAHIKQTLFQKCEQNDTLNKEKIIHVINNSKEDTTTMYYSLDVFEKILTENETEKQFRIKEYKALIKDEENPTQYSVVENGKEIEKIIIPNSENCKSFFTKVVLKVN